MELLLADIKRLFIDTKWAEKWLEYNFWGRNVICPRCGNLDIFEQHNSRYYCDLCKKRFTIRINTIMMHSRLPYDIWAISIYAYQAGVIKTVGDLAKGLNITQKTASLVLKRLKTLQDFPNIGMTFSILDKTKRQKF